jgi:hypothetical protein
MPWVTRESHARHERVRRRVRRWTYDHSQGVTALTIGAATALATVMVVLKLLPI